MPAQPLTRPARRAPRTAWAMAWLTAGIATVATGLSPAAARAEVITIEPGLVQSLPPNTRIFKAPAAPAPVAAAPSAPAPGMAQTAAAPNANAPVVGKPAVVAAANAPAPVATAAAPASAPAHPPTIAMAAPQNSETGVPELAGELGQRIQSMAQESASHGGIGATRVQVEVGNLDPRLRLAPCQKIEPYLPAGLPAWGRTRIGLKCVQGPKAWNVSLPLVVHVWRPSLVLKDPLPAGTVLEARHLLTAEVDMAAGTGVLLTDADQVLGRSLMRPMAAGAALRQPDLKARQWFAAGETVKVVAGGPGWRIATEGQALNPGIEGQSIRVRTEAGKTLQGRAVADRLVEISL